MKKPTGSPVADRNNIDLDTLIKNASRLRLSRGNITSQRHSFAIGSAALEGSTLNRSSIVELDVNDSKDNAAEIEVTNLSALYDFSISTIRTSLESPSGRLLLTPELVRQAHKVAFARLANDAGHYRTSRILVQGSNHLSADAQEVPRLVEDLCKYIDLQWDNSSALHLAAYSLWRLLWIHPFSDGNGRVARALAYVVLSVKLGTILPGTPTLPALIARHRDEYYSVLEAADRSQATGTPDVGPIERFLSELLELQLMNVAPLPETTGKKLNAVFEARIACSSVSTRRTLFGTPEPEYQLWSQSPYLTLQVGSKLELQSTKERQRLFGDPFPRLLSQSSTDAQMVLPENRTVHYLEGTRLSAGDEGALYLPPDAGLILASSSCEIPDGSYQIAGTLYCIRFGPRTTVENCSDLFDLLIARHIRMKS